MLLPFSAGRAKSFSEPTDAWKREEGQSERVNDPKPCPGTRSGQVLEPMAPTWEDGHTQTWLPAYGHTGHSALLSGNSRAQSGPARWAGLGSPQCPLLQPGQQDMASSQAWVPWPQRYAQCPGQCGPPGLGKEERPHLAISSWEAVTQGRLGSGCGPRCLAESPHRPLSPAAFVSW